MSTNPSRGARAITVEQPTASARGVGDSRPARSDAPANVFQVWRHETGVTFDPEERARFTAYVKRKYQEREVFELVVEDYDPKRSLDVNRYWHAEPLPKWAAHLGLSLAHTKLVTLAQCFGAEPTGPDGMLLPVYASTSELGKANATIYTNWLIEEGTERGLNILPPTKDPAQRDKRVYLDQVYGDEERSA